MSTHVEVDALDTVQAELDLALAMYTDELRAYFPTGCRSALEFALPRGVVVEVRVPSAGYPETKHPAVSVLRAPNAVISSSLELRLRAAVISLPLGEPVLVPLLHAVMAEVEEVLADMEQEAASKAAASAASVADDLVGDTSVVAAGGARGGVPILAGQAIACRRSKFLAHVSPVRSMDDVHAVLATLRSVKAIAVAAHPTIYAYRFTDARGVKHSDSEDDGEKGAAAKILFLLTQAGVEGYLVVVTRWFGGILLGPDRFKYICDCARQALVQHRVIGS